MTEHYYSSKPSVQSVEHTWKFQLKGHSFVFTTDRGVFFRKVKWTLAAAYSLIPLPLRKLQGICLISGAGMGDRFNVGH